MTPENTQPSRRTVLKGLALGAAACAMGDLAAEAAAPGQNLTAAGKLPRATPEALGIDPAGILAFVDAVEQKVGGLHGFMLLRHGQVAAESWWTPYGPQHPHMLFSLSKSFTSTAVGFAVAEGLLSVDDPVVKFFPKSLPAKVSDNLAAMHVRHLLSMSTGHHEDATGGTVSGPDGDWVKGFLSLPVQHEPGTHFVYNSAATYMCSAIVQKLTGKRVLNYLKPRLFGPLGIVGPTWETCPRGINTGGWGLSIKTEDIARFGQTYLQHGKWNGRQVVPEAWVLDATSKHISNGTDPNSDWAQGYGYQLWRCRHGAYRGDGAFGQYCIVMQDQDAVLAINSGVGDMQAVLNAAWDHLLPAMKSAPLSGAADLKPRLSSLAIHTPSGEAATPTAKRVSGRAYAMDANDWKVATVTATFQGAKCRVTLAGEEGGRTFECGANTWAKGTLALGEGPSGKVAAKGAWTDADTYTATLCFYETPFVTTLTLKFAGDALTITGKQNVGFGPTEMPTLTGKAGGGA